MIERIKMGSILIEGKTLLPNTLLFESEHVSDGWILAKNLDRYRLEHKIRNAGWTFFLERSDFRAGVFGFDQERTTRKALQQILSRLESKPFNCLEVTAVDFNRILGLLHVSISARARRIRERSIPSGPESPAV